MEGLGKPLPQPSHLRQRIMESIIRFSNVTCAYPRTAEPAINGINFEVKAGEFVALIGPTGAGKSTLCYCFNGVAPQLFSGDMTRSVDVAGCNTYDNETPILSQYVGLVVQNARTQLLHKGWIWLVVFLMCCVGMPES